LDGSVCVSLGKVEGRAPVRAVCDRPESLALVVFRGFIVIRKTVLHAVATAAAGTALLVVSGLPQAFGAVDAGVPITPDAIKVEAVEATVTASGHESADELVVVPGETVTFTTTVRVTVQGDRLSAVLRLDTSELFAVAPDAVRGELNEAMDVELDGLSPADGIANAWVVPARSEPYDVSAVVTVEMPDLKGMQGQPLSTGELTWSVTQTAGRGGAR